ncbi:hypothetical protein BTM500_07850 [Helicobacter pylori]
MGVVSNLFNYPLGLNANDFFKFYQFFHKNCTPNLFEKNLLNKTYEHLSDGQKQRLKIDLALSHHPQLVIMDELETSSVAITFDLKERLSAKDLLALLKDI